MVDTSDEWIQDRTGIRERRVVSLCQANSDLSVKAVEQCLAQRGLSGDEIDLIVGDVKLVVLRVVDHQVLAMDAQQFPLDHPREPADAVEIVDDEVAR